MPPYVAEVRKPLREAKPALASRLFPWASVASTSGEKDAALHRLLTVGLDEHEQDVFAAQRGQQPVRGRVGERVVLDLGGEHATIVDVGLHRSDLVDHEAGGQSRGDRRVGDELRAEHPAEQSDSAEPRERPQRPAAVVGRDAGQPEHRQRQQDGQYDGADNRADLDQLRLRTTDQGAQRLDPVPELGRVAKRVIWPVVEREHLVIGDLQDDHQREGQAGDHRQDVSRGAGQEGGHRNHDQSLERDPQEPGQREVSRLVGGDEGDPHEQRGEDREPYAQCISAPARGLPKGRPYHRG